MQKVIAEKRIIGGRDCFIYDCGSPDTLLIQQVDDHDIEMLDSEVNRICELVSKGFTLAAFRVNDWNTDLSPWEAAPVFGDAGFGSGAEDTLRYVLESLIPEMTGTGAGTQIYLGGYSLAGFFSLWAAYQTDRFAGVAAVSPSVWFPGWMDFAREHSIRTPRVYLSLGDKEERTRNPVMRTVGDNIRSQLELLESDADCTDCTLEMNQGNHFREPDNFFRRPLLEEVSGQLHRQVGLPDQINMKCFGQTFYP